jgi:hypothetical protein
MMGTQPARLASAPPTKKSQWRTLFLISNQAESQTDLLTMRSR